jgi:poly(3-hydroxybutyrate) depolymerase
MKWTAVWGSVWAVVLCAPVVASKQCSPTGLAGSTNVSIVVNGQTRIFELYIPFAYNPPKVGPPISDTPLVLNWHGCNADYPELDYHLEISKVLSAASLGRDSKHFPAWGCR